LVIIFDGRIHSLAIIFGEVTQIYWIWFFFCDFYYFCFCL